MTENLNAYINASNAKKTFGLSLYGSSEKVSGKLAELDFIDIFTNYGIIGFIVLTIYLFLILIIIIIKFLKDFKNNILDDEVCSNCLSFSIAILISLTAGHVLGAPAVSTILSLTMVYLIKKFNLFKDNKLIDIILILISAFYLLLAITYLCIPYNNSIVKINIINNDITIENNVKLVESKEITYNNIKDKLFYYVPTDNKRFKIIYVKRIFENNDEINFLTFNNEEDKNILVQMTILNDYSKYEETANGLLIESDQNILISNSYHYNNITNNVKKFNKNAAKNLLKEQIDFSRNNGQVRKNINIKSNTSVDSYIIVSNNDLINKNEIIPWLSYNGTYERKTDSIYTKTLDNINLDYSLEYFNNLLIKNYLITLNKYSNNQNNIWYKDYEIDNESNVSHNDIYLDFGLNYDIYSNLELFNIKTSSIYENISNILLKELDAGNYIETKNGIIFNKYIEPTFNNQIAILNILLKDYNNNKRYRIKNLINNLLSELENDNWVFNDNIHEYLTEEKTYQGEIKDFNIISDLISLNENLHNVYIYNSKIDNYINILYLKFKDNISGDILTKLKNYGYIS